MNTLISYLLILGCIALAITHEVGHWPIPHWVAISLILSIGVSAYFRGALDEMRR